jgi:hypothetical protein
MERGNLLPPPIDRPRPREPRRRFRRIGFFVLCIFAFLGVSFAALTIWAVRAGTEFSRSQEEARVFAASATDSACLSTAASRLELRWITWIATYETAFLLECLAGSTQTSVFCTGVPSQLDEAASISWLNKRCSDFQGDEIGCQQLMVYVQSHCDDRTGDGAA